MFDPTVNVETRIEEIRKSEVIQCIFNKVAEIITKTHDDLANVDEKTGEMFADMVATLGTNLVAENYGDKF